MSGWNTNGVPELAAILGSAAIQVDAKSGGGALPQSGQLNLLKLGTALLQLTQSVSETLVANERYYTQIDVGYSTLPGSAGANTSTWGNPQFVEAPPVLLTGIQFLIGGTGGTDKWIAELHDVNGNVLANSAVAGVTVGTAGRWQQFPFTAPYLAQPGTYFLTLQTNGTTATVAAYNAPSLPYFTGATADGGGSFGDLKSFTAPTAYAQGIGPVALVY